MYQLQRIKNIKNKSKKTNKDGHRELLRKLEKRQSLKTKFMSTIYLVKCKKRTNQMKKLKLK